MLMQMRNLCWYKIKTSLKKNVFFAQKRAEKPLLEQTFVNLLDITNVLEQKKRK